MSRNKNQEIEMLINDNEIIFEILIDEYFDPLSSVLRVHIARLKKKLKEVGKKEILITNRGVGYSICED